MIIPHKIKDFITNISDSRVIYDEITDKYYCPKCLVEMSDESKCSKCLQEFILTRDNEVSIFNIKEIKNYNYDADYYIFDIVNGNILLYVLREHVSYDNPLSFYQYKMSKITIDTIYRVLSNEIIDFTHNKHFYYKDLEEIKRKINLPEYDYPYDEEVFDTYEEFEFPKSNFQYLYTDNLDELRNTKLYKYSNIWDLKEYLKDKSFILSSITYYPICCTEFEYLIKMKLYDLAINSADLIKYDGSFKKTFGVKKEYYSFMKNIDINYKKLYALILYPTTDLKILNFISDNIWLFEQILKYVNFDKVQNYFKEQGLSMNNFHEYADYIRCSGEMKLNLKDNNVSFSKHFIEKHDKITNDMVIANDPETNKRIKTLSNILLLNKYEDDKYIIFPASSVDSLIDESSQQSNCVRTYCDMVSNNKCQIYFMRYKDKVNKSLVTSEVVDGKIVQARTRFNELPTDEMNEILEKWEKQLILVTNAKE